MISTFPKLQSAAPLKFDGFVRSDLREYFLNTWELYEMLKGCIRKEEYFYEAPDPLRHPLIFYLGHTAVFYINKLKMSGILSEGINPRYETLFAVGVDPEAEDDLEKEIDWPSVADVWQYRNQVKETVLRIIDELPASPSCEPMSPMWALHMALEHERIHFETSSVLIRQYPVEYLQRPAHWNYAPTEFQPPSARMIPYAGRKIELGKPSNFPTFGWDNEYGRLEVEVEPFEVANLMITNGQFNEFVLSGGYDDRSFWTDESWEWKENLQLKAPAFWVQDGDAYLLRTMFDEIPLPSTWPAEVTSHEAEAYINWRNDGFRLMTEAEWKIVSGDAPELQGDSVFADCHNLNLKFGSPSPVGYFGDGCSQDGIYDIYGNVWDWLSNDFYPLPGFEVHPWYVDFSQPFMDDQHGMLLGGAWASTGTSASKYYRLWFRRGFLQHAGFRLARSL